MKGESIMKVCIERRANRSFSFFSITLSVIILSAFILTYSCGGGLKDKRQEEVKKEMMLSSEEKLSLAKNYLERGLFSDAKRFFLEVEKTTSLKDCKEGESGFNECPYCDALYGGYLADFLGTLKLVGDLMGMLSSGEGEGKETKMKEMRVNAKSSDEISEFDRQIGASFGETVETFVGLFLKRVDALRQKLGKIISANCSMQSSVTIPIKLTFFEIVFPAEQKGDKTREFLYSPIFARFSWAFLSIVAGVLDIAYSQNYALSLTATFQFLKDVINTKTREEALLLLGDFFAKNPSFLSLNEERKNMWEKARKDFADSLTGINTFIEDFCGYRKAEVTKAFLDGILSSLIERTGLGGEDNPLAGAVSDSKAILCEPLPFINAPIGELASYILDKWASALYGKNECKVEEEGKIRKTYEFDSDGCIRFVDDLTSAFVIQTEIDLGGIFGSPLLPESVKNILSLEIAVHPIRFFSPKGLREIFPLMRRTEEGKFLLGIEVEERNDIGHFQGDLWSVADGFPSLLSKNAAEIPKDCVAPEKKTPLLLYIPFSDPSFGGALFLSTEKLSKGDACYSAEREMGIADEEYLVLPDLKSGNYALNKIISKTLGSIVGMLLGGEEKKEE